MASERGIGADELARLNEEAIDNFFMLWHSDFYGHGIGICDRCGKPEAACGPLVAYPEDGRAKVCQRCMGVCFRHSAPVVEQEEAQQESGPATARVSTWEDGEGRPADWEDEEDRARRESDEAYAREARAQIGCRAIEPDYDPDAETCVCAWCERERYEEAEEAARVAGNCVYLDDDADAFGYLPPCTCPVCRGDWLR